MTFRIHVVHIASLAAQASGGHRRLPLGESTQASITYRLSI
jgi:hypothetical protein